MEKTENKSLSLTDRALARINNVMSTNEDLGTKFRVQDTGGGCSGFQYGFKFDSDVAFDDDVIEFDNFSVLLDSMSYPYLFGSTLDFVEDLSGSKFVINNPNAKTTCGCGESFTIQPKTPHLYLDKQDKQSQQLQQTLMVFCLRWFLKFQKFYF